MLRSRRVLLLTLFAVTVVLVLVVVLSRPGPVSAQTWPSLPYQSEDQWIVSETARAVIDLAQFARTAAPAPPAQLVVSKMTADPAKPLQLTFHVGSREVVTDLKTYVWDPDAYLSLAKTEGAVGTGSDAAPNQDVAAALLDFKVETFQVQNDAISIALQKEYRNPAHHEAAALLLSTFALREIAGTFYDPRLVLCRAVAHLAIARALRGAGAAASPAGELAGIVVQVVAGRSGPAMRQLEAFERTDPSPTALAWARALRYRATVDWRVQPSDDAPLLERLEYMRALARMLGVSTSLEYITTHRVEPVPDWGWRTLDLPMTVANGHTFVDDSLERTLTEIAQVLRIGSNSTEADVAVALSGEPSVSSLDRGSSRGIRVIDDGMWSAFYQRELAHVAVRGSEFYRDFLSSDEAADRFDSQVDRLLIAEPIWPIVQRLRIRTAPVSAEQSKKDAVAADYRATMGRVVPLLRDRPQMIPYLAWLGVSQVPRGVAAIDVPQLSLWFRTTFPSGTVFESRRMNAQRIVPNDFVTQADAIHALAPWAPEITIGWSLVRCRKGCTLEQERANFSNIEEYSVTAMERFASRDADPVASMRRVCKVSAPGCWTLADWLVSRDRFPEAATVFEEYIRRGLDRVAVSNNVEWIVRYYQQSGRAADARRIAMLASEVGSLRGMRALAGFHDRRGEHQQAEALYRQILDRYDEGHDLLAFFLRRADAAGRPADDPKYPALLEKYFSGELQEVAINTLSGPPARGLFVASPGWWQEKAGFRKGDIIVAVDGIRVWTPDQSSVLYERSFDAPLRYTVWRGDRYLDVEGLFRRYYYGVGVTEYPPRRPEPQGDR
jgi:hypothetical protein